MRILSLRIHGYGCLSDFRLHLGPHLTCLVGPNESGKSTLIAAIIALLYDHTRGAQRDNDLNNRMRPWQGDHYGGEIEIETECERLRVSRDFSSRQARAHLGDGSDVTAKYARARVVDVGSPILGLDRTLFSSLAVVRQRELVFASDTARQVISLITELVEAPDGAPTAKAACDSLSGWLKTTVNPAGASERTSPLLRARADVGRLQADLATARAALLALEPLAQRERGLMEKADECEHELLDAERDLAAARASDLHNRLRRVDAALADAESAREERAALGSLPDPDLVEKACDLVGSDQALSNAMATTREERSRRIDELDLDLSALDDRLAGIDESVVGDLVAVESAIKSEAAAPKGGSVPLMAALLAVVGAALGYVAVDLVGAVAGGVLGAVVGLVFGRQTQPGRTHIADEDRERLAEWLRQVDVSSADAIRPILARREIARSECNNLVDQREREDGALRESAAAAEAALRAVGIASHGPEAQADLESLTNRIRLARELDLRASTSAGIANAMLGGDTRSALEVRLSALDVQAGGRTPRADRGASELEAEVDALRIQRDSAHQAAVAASTIRTHTESAVESPPSLEAELTAAREKLERLERVHRAITSASERIDRESRALRGDIVPGISGSLSQQFGEITLDRYREITLDPATLAITARSLETAVPVDFGALSQGTQDALLVLLRLAILDRMANSRERSPLILDDPLLAVDVDRARSLARLLGQVARDRQVLFLTHDERLASLLAECGDAEVRHISAPTGVAIG